MKKIYFLILVALCIVTINSVFSQDPPVTCVTEVPPDYYDNPTSCTRNSYDWQNFFRLKDSYVPYNDGIPIHDSPIKTIEVNLNIFQRSDGTGNFQNTPADKARLLQILQWVNDKFALGPPSDPFPSVIELPNFDSKIRFILGESGNERIYFYQDDNLFCQYWINTLEAAVINTDPSRMEQLNVYLAGGSYSQSQVISIEVTNGGSGYTSPPTVIFTPSGATGTAVIQNGSVEDIIINSGGSYSGCPPAITFSGGSGSGAEAICHLNGAYYASMPIYNIGQNDFVVMTGQEYPDPDGDWVRSIFLAHEFGHNLDLRHTYLGGGASAQCNPTDPDQYLPDVFGTPQPGNCPHDYKWSEDAWAVNGDGITNNLMSGNKEARYESPLQTGQMQRALALKSVRKYADQEAFITSPLVINSSFPINKPQPEIQEWDFNIKLYSDLVVENGAQLTIKCEVVIPYQGRIIVKQGGKLIIDGGKITTDAKDRLWGGIVVYGNEILSQIPQSNQGWVHIIDGIIENATCGIRTVIPVPDGGGGQQEPTGTGGIVFAENTTFRNCRIGIDFLPYSFNNMSYVKDCTFETTDELLDQTIPDYFMKLQGVSGIDIKGNIFVNTRTSGSIPEDERGSGVYAFNSDVLVQALCTSTIVPCPENDYQHNVFQDLYYGVYALSSGVSKTVIVDRTDFITNYRGFYLGATSYATITRNFIHPWEDQNTQNPQTYGFYLDQCTGYQIEENEFNTSNPSQLGIGLIINNSGEANNQVYKNYFANLRYGAIAQDDNRGLDNDGLCYKCNSFSNNLYDVRVSISYFPILSPYSGIANHQGANIPGDNTAPAGNVFTTSTTAYNMYNSGNSFIYYHHQNQNSYKVIPYPIGGPGLITVSPVPNTTYIPSLVCPSNLSESGGSSEDERSAMESAEALALTTQVQLDQLIDEGNTPELDAEVESSMPSQSAVLHQDLLSISPFLSNDVMESGIEKEDVLPNAMIRDILVANPQAAKSDPLLDKLEERTIPMPDYMWAEIMQGEGIVEAKENLEAKVNHWNHKRYFHWNNLFRIFINEPENVSFIDSLFLLLQIEPAPAAKYELAFQHLENGDYSAANSVITQIPSQFQLEPDQQEDWQAMTSYLSSLNTLFSSNPITLYPESGLAAVFSALMTGSGNQASAYARNVLINAGLTTYNEPILLNESIKIGRKKRFREGGSNMISSNSCLRVFPNPAGDYFIAETHLEYENSAGILRIIDLTGQKILQYNIRYKDDQTVISTRDLTTGFYIVQLIEGKKVFAVTKIEIQ